MPPPLDARSPGCFVAIVLYVVTCGLLFRWTGWWISAVLAAPAIVGLGTVLSRELRGLLLLVAARWKLEARGVRFVVIYSESPNWETHIRSIWFPRFGRTAALLNWTERAQWQPTLEVRLFNHFVKSWRNFNPAVIVLRGFRRPLVYRFYYAFHYAKAGRTDYLNKLEAELFEHLADSRGIGTTP